MAWINIALILWPVVRVLVMQFTGIDLPNLNPLPVDTATIGQMSQAIGVLGLAKSEKL